jgi:hypothetical protein
MSVLTKPIQIKRGFNSNWNSKNPILNEGELGFNTTNNLIKIGNGINTWLELSYISNINEYYLINNIAQIKSIRSTDSLILNKNTLFIKANDIFTINSVEYIIEFVNYDSVTKEYVYTLDRNINLVIGTDVSIKIKYLNLINRLNELNTKLVTLKTNYNSVKINNIETYPKKTTLANYEIIANKNIANGYLGLNSVGKINDTYLPTNYYGINQSIANGLNAGENPSNTNKFITINEII